MNITVKYLSCFFTKKLIPFCLHYVLLDIILDIWESLFTRACCDRTRGNALTQEEGRFGLNIEKKFLPLRVWDTGTRCSEKFWMPHPWNHSRPGWKRLWNSNSSERCPTHGRWSLKSLPTPTIQWFYVDFKCPHISKYSVKQIPSPNDFITSYITSSTKGMKT